MQRFLRYDPVFTGFVTLFLACTGLAVMSEQPFYMLIPFSAIALYSGWQNSRILFFLLIAALPFSMEYNFSATLGTDLPDEPMMLLVTGLFIARLIYNPRVLDKARSFHPLLLLLALTLLWAIVAATFSSHPLLSVKYLLAKSWYIGAFVIAPLILFTEKKNIAATAVILAAALTFIALIALWRHYPYGFSFAHINDAVYPFFRNHVNYSAMLVCSLPLLFVLHNYAPAKWIVIAAITAVLAALFFSYARGAWLALFTGAMAWWLIRKRWLLHAYIIALLATGASVYWLQKDDHYLKYSNDFKTTIFHKDFSEHLIATYKLKDVSTAERFYRWVAGARMVKDKPLTGYGPGTFYYHYKDYAVPAFKTWVSDNEDHSTVHNYFLLTLIEQGIPGLLLQLLLFGAILFYAQRLYHRLPSGLHRSAALAAGLITVMVLTVNFLSDLIETDKVGSLFFLCLSVLIAVDVNTKKAAASDSSSDIQGIP